MDSEEHSDGDGRSCMDYEAVRKERTTNLAQMTRLYKELEKKMVSRENTEMVKNLYTKLCDRFEHFKTAHLNCLDVCPRIDIAETLEMNFENCETNLKEFRERFSEWINVSEETNKEDEVCSGISTVSSANSSKSRLRQAKANRLKAEHQLRKTEEKLKLQRERKELEIKEQLLEKRGELEEAKLEEQVWQEAYEEDNDITNVNTNENKSICVEVADCSSRSNTVINSDINFRRIRQETEVKRTEPEAKREVTVGSSQSSTSSIDSAFQRLASTLQEGFNLPKPELLTFDGKPIDYCKFIKNFEANVESRVTDNQMRLSYLIQYCKGEAKSAIEDCVLLESVEGYRRARSILYSRYGRSHLIARSYIDKLVNGTQINANDWECLSNLALDMQKCEITLSQLGFISDIDNSDNLRKIVKRLPMHLRVRWVDVAHSITETGREPRFSDLTNFIDQKSRIAASMYGLDLIVKGKPEAKIAHVNKHNENVNGRVSTFVTNNVNTGKKVEYEHKCVCCNGTCRYVETCNKFKSMSLTERTKLVRKCNLCFNCLKGKHFSKDCSKPKTCSVVDCEQKYKHHVLLHSWVRSDNNYTATKVSINCSSTGTVIKNGLGIIPVTVKGRNGSTCETYALVDNGADKTLCDERLIHKLGMESRPISYTMTTATSQKSQQIGKEIEVLEVQSMQGEDPIEIKKVWSVKRLPVSTRLAVRNDDFVKFSYLSDICIPEINTDDVLLLIGTDVPAAHIPLEVRSGSDQDPYAVRTRLGWIVRGPITGNRRTDEVFVNFEESHETLLQKQLQRLWTTDFGDTIEREKTCMSLEDKQALKTMESTIVHDEGHYKMGLPWRNEDITLPNNLPLAQIRLQHLHRKLSRDPKLHEMYKTTVNDYIEKGYAKEVTDNSNGSSRVWYLPHHPVTNEHKPGKVRVVFDCAAKYKGVSLNDQLLQGPDLMNSLVGVLIRFRQERVAIAADIEAMFHQVQVKNDDCNALRFLWWPKGELDRKPVCYQMQVHLFGAKSSPSCAAFALKRTANDNANLFEPEVASTVERNFYVDDLLKSVETEDKAIQLASNLQEMMKMGGFRLTKWLSNSKTVLHAIPESERASSVVDLDSNSELPTDRALGVTWDINEDKLKFKVKIGEEPMTRRGITSTISSIFDPLGLISPVTLSAKVMLQDLCRREKLGWDDEIPIEKQKEWMKWKSSLPELEKVFVSRCFKLRDFGTISETQLHVFCDGSERGYGSCAYLRITDTQGKINCSLVLGKSRLAPIKQTTIPRMELSGAVVACRLYEIIRDELDIKLDTVTFWSDSMIVLGYIRNVSRRFKTFVANRLSVIHDLTSVDQWRHIDTKLNPADIASRGIYAGEDKRMDMWLNGPVFLWKDSSQWPVQNSVPCVSTNDLEIKKEITVNTTTSQVIQDLVSYYSNWNSLQRAVAWMLRFKRFCKSRFLKNNEEVSKGNLTVNEIRDATIAIVQQVQQECFPSEIANLTKDKPIGKDSRIASLDPILFNGILRVKGRLDLPDNMCPVILPNSHHVTNLIIRSYHEQNGHVGMTQTLSLLREKYWILKGPSSVRKVLNKCVSCKRYRGPTCSQKMAPVIEEQKLPDKPPFTFVGVDYFGPLNVKVGRSVVKRYGCIFTCLTTRAIHLEVTHSLTTESFIAAFQRFTSRRGTPEKVYSDNGTNIVGGEHELRKSIEQWNQENIAKFMSQKYIQWIFNPPHASHRGGVWERMIRSTRQILKALANEQLLTDEKLLTFMTEAERIINDRPITTVSNDLRDPRALTPSMLLLMKGNNSIPPGIFNPNDIYARRWWRQIQYLADVFWKRWVREYLPLLQQRNKWQRQTEDIKLNDIVLLVEENISRGQWPLGRVVDVVLSRDGLVRSCVVKTSKSQVVRPINKLCKLECSL